MNWLATDRLGRRWYPYIATNLEGKHEVLMHHELDDTDMGDLEMEELVNWFGPVTVSLIKGDE